MKTIQLKDSLISLDDGKIKHIDEIESIVRKKLSEMTAEEFHSACYVCEITSKEGIELPNGDRLTLSS